MASGVADSTHGRDADSAVSELIGGTVTGARRDLPAVSAGNDFVSRVLAVVESIPPGSVMTYGDVAAAIGSRAARAVGQVMAYYGSTVPWWRVIRSTGQAPLCHDASALVHYEAEATPLLPSSSDAGYRVNLRAARHHP